MDEEKRTVRYWMQQRCEHAVEDAAKLLNDPNVVGIERDLANNAYRAALEYLEGSKPDAESTSS